MSCCEFHGEIPQNLSPTTPESRPTQRIQEKLSSSNYTRTITDVLFGDDDIYKEWERAYKAIIPHQKVAGAGKQKFVESNIYMNE